MKPYLKYTFSLAWHQKKLLIQLVILQLLETAVRLVQPFFYKIVVDTLTAGIVTNTFSQTQVNFLFSIILAWFLCAVLNNLFSAQDQYIVWKIGNESSQKVHLEGYKRLLKLDYYKHTQKHSSRYAKIVDDADTSMWEMTNWWLGRFFSAIVGFVAMLIIAFSVSWQMTLISLTVIPPGLAIVIFMINKYDSLQRKANKLWEKKHEHLSDQVANIIGSVVIWGAVF